MNVLVTGGAGFIGSHIVDRLLAAGHQVTVLDNLSTGKRDNLDSSCQLEVGDIQDSDLVRRFVVDKEVVFHLAAFTSVAGSIEHPETCLQINVNGTVNLLEAACQAGVKRVVFSSTSAIYPDHIDRPMAEDSLPDPKSPYAQSKLEGESLLRQHHERYGLSWAALRYFNVYGLRQDAKSDYAAVIPAFVAQIWQNEALTIYGDGRQTRDFVYVEDVAAANLMAMESEECGIFNVGTSNPISILSLAKTLIRMGGSKSTYIFADPRPGDALSSTADISLISEKLGWAPEWDLASGLRKVMGGLEPVAFQYLPGKAE